MKGVFVRGRHFSAEGLLSIDGMVASTVVEGSMTRTLFVEYLEFIVVCHSLLLLALLQYIMHRTRCRSVRRFLEI